LRSSLKESDIVIVEEKPVKTNKPVLITGFQDMGLIGVVAIMHIINSLRMEEVGYLRSRFIPTVKLIRGSEFRTLNSFRIYKNPAGDLLALVNDSPAGFIGMSPFFSDIGKTLADWFHKKEVRLVVALGSYPIKKDEKPNLVAYSMDSERLEELTKLGFKPLEQGFLGGLIVSIIDECIERKIPWLMLFGPTRRIGEVDSEGVQMIIDSINKMMGLNIALPPVQKIGSKRRSIRSLMRR